MMAADPGIRALELSSQALARSMRRLAVLFGNAGTVPECLATLSDKRTYRFIDPCWQPGSTNRSPLHPEYQSPAWCAHEVLVAVDEDSISGDSFWRTLLPDEQKALENELWPEVYEAVASWADKDFKGLHG
ncbi:MAG: hypothetical protein QMD09_11715 [Desulfatibacillaceae bacterium]|nr:hypothetical protein [Desulfatibacillaceae bacterium]